MKHIQVAKKKKEKKKKVTFDPRKTLQDVHLQFLPLWQILLISSLMFNDLIPHEMTCSVVQIQYVQCMWELDYHLLCRHIAPPAGVSLLPLPCNIIPLMCVCCLKYKLEHHQCHHK